MIAVSRDFIASSALGIEATKSTEVVAYFFRLSFFQTTRWNFLQPILNPIEHRVQ